jgi:hypothetical protein
MNEFLQFTFQSFWHFLGVWILLGTVVTGVVKTAAIIAIAILDKK